MSATSRRRTAPPRPAPTFPNPLDGPAIWTDPAVNDTIFVNDDLATALKAEPYGKALRLKKVRLSESPACAGQSQQGLAGTPEAGGAG